ncbi:formate dehydrogenase accessory sulfurtransferase FdhD [Haloferula sargassicola]|uniref:Sulfur carrier protein FdhD n=1 Tax=Haloferula sargassicola TaxID=490096 RepID=A0ABP9UN79_9BACT
MDRLVPARAADGSLKDERVAVEEPLQITLDGCPVAVVMRTPGHDDDLVRGFLVTEGILKSTAAIRRIDLDSKDNHALVFLADDAEFDPARLQRNLYSASSCGICGKASIDAILAGFAPLENARRFPAAALLGAPERLRAAQETFDTTGGLHAAALFDADGEMLALREDVGRHNAVDKLVGHALATGFAVEDTFLLVSGRVSFEIMQKALGARIPLVAAISAPSSLAVEFAVRSGQTLVGFLRPPRFNLYAGGLDRC